MITCCGDPVLSDSEREICFSDLPAIVGFQLYEGSFHFFRYVHMRDKGPNFTLSPFDVLTPVMPVDISLFPAMSKKPDKQVPLQTLSFIHAITASIS